MKDELVEVFNRIDSIIGDAEGVSLDVYLKKGGYSVAEAYVQITRYISDIIGEYELEETDFETGRNELRREQRKRLEGRV